MTERERIGLVITKLRKEKDWTQKELADKVGVLQKTISGIERGKFSTGLDILVRIGDQFGLKLDFVND